VIAHRDVAIAFAILTVRSSAARRRQDLAAAVDPRQTIDDRQPIMASIVSAMRTRAA